MHVRNTHVHILTQNTFLKLFFYANYPQGVNFYAYTLRGVNFSTFSLSTRNWLNGHLRLSFGGYVSL